MLGLGKLGEQSLLHKPTHGVSRQAGIRHLAFSPTSTATLGTRSAPVCACLPASSDDAHVVRPQTQAPAAPPNPQPSQQQRSWAKRQRFLRSEPGDEDDVVEINCGGEIMLTSRSTLTQVPGSLLKDMFCRKGSKVRGLKKDLKGQVFLDYDPYCFGQVLRLLRSLKMNGGSWKGLSMPSVRSSEEKHFRHLLNYLLSPQMNEAKRGTFPVNALSKDQQQAEEAGSVQLSVTDGTQPLSVGATTARGEANDAELEQAEHPSGDAGSQSKHRQAVSQASRDSGAAAKKDNCFETTSSGQAQPQHQLQPRQHQHPRRRSIGSGGGSKNPGMGSQTDLFGSASPSHSPARAPMVFSQMYYIHVQSDVRRGTKISVSTEADLAARSATNAEPFDIFANATYTGSQMSFSFVCRRDFEDIFIGLTSRSQLDRKGASIPSMGWRGSNGNRLYSSKAVGQPGGLDAAEEGAPRRLWGKGDCVELIVTMAPPSNANASQPSSSWLASRMVLKVNGKEVDAIEQLPPLRSWCWYLALHTGGDVSCVSFLRDSYSVFWGDYQVKRFI